MLTKYILDGHNAVPCDDLLVWGKWLETTNRHVGDDRIGDKRVSTVFLGLDHSLSDDGPPLLFETMVFEGENYKDIHCERYSTWEEAEAGHKRILASYHQPSPDST